MTYVVKALAILFGLLHIAAAAVSVRRKKNCDTAAMMAFGSAVMAVSSVLPALDWLAAFAGGVLVCGAALLNGRRNGKVNLNHHAVRGAFAAIIVLGYVIW